MAIGIFQYQPSTKNRVTGMFSGMDTTSLVNQLMSIEQMKVDKVFQQREKAQWRNDAYSSVNTQISNLRNSFLSALGSNSVVKNSTYNTYKASVSENNAIKITATDTANARSFSIKSVKAATSASVSSNVRSEYSENGAVKRTDTIKQAAEKLGVGDQVGDSLNVTINGKAFTFSSSTSLSSMMNTINNDKDANAVFSFSEMTDSFSISSQNTGEATRVSVSGLGIFGLNTGENANNLVGNTAYKNGSDAEIKLGDGSTIKQSTNAFTLDGLKFEVLGDFEEVANNSIKVDVARDNSATVDAIKGFITEYNKLIEDLNSLYTGKVNRKYEPLTENQRSELTDSEAASWDEMAKSGILRNDPVIGSLLTSLRSGFYAKVGDTGMSAADIGLTTMKWSDMADWKTDQGKIAIDEEKLLAALDKNPSAVQDVFNKISYDESGNVDKSIKTVDGKSTASSGLFTRFSEILSSVNSTLRNQSIQNTSKQVDEYTTKMNEMLSKMSDIEEKYWKQYSALETALSKMQTTSSWLSQQFGSSSS